MKLIKNSILIISFLFLIGCSTKEFNSTYFFDKKENKIVLNKNIKIQLSKPEIKYQSFNCADYSYILKDENSSFGKIFIENINVSQSCRWNGLPSSFFQYSLKKNLNIKSMKTIESLEFRNFSFETFIIDNEYFLSLIYIFDNYNDKFILDYDGKLYISLLKTFNKEYIDKYSSKKRFNGNYNASLVRQSIYENYFDIVIEPLNR